MLDFTSALYLGLQHPSSGLPSWTSLTLGKPAALEEPPGMRAVEQKLAALTGCDDVMLASSTLHAFFDLFAVLAGPGTAVYIDRSSYPISRWAGQRACTESATALFRSHDAAELGRALFRTGGVRPLIVTDGLSPAIGVVAPIAQYAALAARRRGIVLVDDTQGLGILGVSANADRPYGIGGGGSLRNTAVRSDEVIVVNSLAKSFGVPVAMVGGGAPLIASLRSNSPMRSHGSPPSVPVIVAAAQALEQNCRHGEALRERLVRNVARLRSGLKQLGIAASRSLFPVQTLRLPSATAVRVHATLLQRGVHTVLQRNSESGAQLTFLVTARHTAHEIDEALGNLAYSLEVETHSRPIGVGTYDTES